MSETTELNDPTRDAGMSTPEPAPQASEHPAVWGLVIADMQQRDGEGERKYGKRLQPFNGRRPLRDLYQEVLDAAVYIRQAIYEEDAREAEVQRRIEEAVLAERMACAELALTGILNLKEGRIVADAILERSDSGEE